MTRVNGLPHVRDRRRRLWAFLTENGPGTTYRQITAALGYVSQDTIADDLRVLTQLGYIARGPKRKNRTLIIVVPFVALDEGIAS